MARAALADLFVMTLRKYQFVIFVMHSLQIFRSTGTMCEICSKLTIETPDRHQ